MKQGCRFWIWILLALALASPPGQARAQETTVTLPGNVPLVLVRIPAGNFQMGSPDTERSRYTDEGPVHPVGIGYSFYMGKTELTQKQWLAVMGSWPGAEPIATTGVGDDYPAYFISWVDCQNFLTQINTLGIGVFRLPSEAEWEYACRGGTQTRFFFGDSLLSTDDGFGGDGPTDGPAGTLPGNRSDYLWWWFNCQDAPNAPYGTKPAATKRPNQFGLYDMGGNVYEWCQDWYHDSYSGAPADGSAWTSPAGSNRVLRGGSWRTFTIFCRSAVRNYYDPGFGGDHIGVRLVAATLNRPPARAADWSLFQ